MPHASEIESFIRHFEERAAPVEKAVGEAWWNLATTGTEDARKELVRAGNAYNQLFSERAAYEKVRGWYEGRHALENLLLRRQVEVLYLTYAGRQGDPGILERIEELEAEANATYSNHRARVRGGEIGENEVRDTLRDSGDEELRRETWEASKTVGREIEETVRELARLRNQLAREAGYENHYYRSLSLQEIDAEELARTMSQLESATEAPFRELKNSLDENLKERFASEQVMPWHLSDPFFQSCKHDPVVDAGTGPDVDHFFRNRDLEALTRKTYDNIGLEVRDVLARSDLYEREGKSQHAFCLGIGRGYPYDVRVLANVKPDAYWMTTMLHEFGHAVYDKHINPRLPYLLRSIAHVNTTEAIALMMGSLADDPDWISTVVDVPEPELDATREHLIRQEKADRLVFTRWALVMFNFERELYAEPDRDDLNSVWWDLVERLQLVERPPGRDEPDWAAKLHVALAPVYYHNYVIGHLTAAQLRSYIENYISRGPFFMSEVSGRYLLEAVFGPGARDDWKDTVHRATGEPLNPDYFVESLQ
ncbi:MAG: M2 family metallopeptidase [Rubrobacteraceae bacterium]